MALNNGKYTATTHEVLELGVKVFPDGESCVGNGFVEVRVEVTDHLKRTNNTVPATNVNDNSRPLPSRIKDQFKKALLPQSVNSSYTTTSLQRSSLQRSFGYNTHRTRS